MAGKAKKGEPQFSARTAAFLGLGVAVAGVGAYAISKSNKPKTPYTLAQWKRACVNGSLQFESLRELLEICSDKGLDVDAKKEVWPYLLGVYSPGSSPASRQEQLQELQASYQALLQACRDKEASIQELVAQQRADSLAAAAQLVEGDPPSPTTTAASTPATSPGPPLATTSSGSHHQQPYLQGMATSETVPEELRQFWEAQRIIVMDAIRTDFKKNSLTAVEAITSWFNSALADSTLYQKLSAKDEWWQAGWLSGLARHQLSHASHFSSDQKRQVVRLVGLLSAYAVHDPDTGYCQGMSDLALPFLLVLEDDALAFWCFEALMRKVRRNFAIEDSGIFAQLGALGALLERVDGTLFYKLRQVRATDCHFAYRMIVVLMRRELPLDGALRLWEMLWADDLQHALGLTTNSHASGAAAASSQSQGPSGLQHAATLQPGEVVPAGREEGGDEEGGVGSTGAGLLGAASAPADVLAALASGVQELSGSGTPENTGGSRRVTTEDALSLRHQHLHASQSGSTLYTPPAALKQQSGEDHSHTTRSHHTLRAVDSASLLAAGVLATPYATPSGTPHAPPPTQAPPDPVSTSLAPLHTPTTSPTAGATGPATPTWLTSSPTGAAMVDSLQAAVPMLPPDQPSAAQSRSHSRQPSTATAPATGLDGSAAGVGLGTSSCMAASPAVAPVSGDDEMGASAASDAVGTSGTQQATPEPQLGLFLYFVAAVVTAQRRRLLDDCTEAEDVIRAFQQVPSLRVDVQDCMRRARVYRERDRRQAALALQATTTAGGGAATTPAAAPRPVGEQEGVDGPDTPPQDNPSAGVA